MCSLAWCCLNRRNLHSSLEGDTFAHSWEILAQIISDEVCKDMLVDLGMGCRHRNVRYNWYDSLQCTNFILLSCHQLTFNQPSSLHLQESPSHPVSLP